ncbi:MAG: heavy metal-associated domain-containing protein [Burkholderiaceae bacterium]
MEQSFEITGMHCMGCVARVSKALSLLADEASVTLEPPRAVFDTPSPLTVEEVQAALTAIGDYTVRAL